MNPWKRRERLALVLINPDDIQQATADMRPEDAKKFWKFLESKDFLNALQNNNSGAKMQVNAFLTARIFKCSLAWTPGLFTAESFRDRVGYFTRDSTRINKFEAIPVYSQEALWVEQGLMNVTSRCAERGYLDLLKLTKIPLRYFDSVGPNQKALAEATPEINKLNLDLTPATDKFFEVLDSAFAYDTACNADEIPPFRKNEKWFIFGKKRPYESALLLRARYTESVVIEFIEKIISTNEIICLDNAIKILDNWEENRNFPISWISNINGYKVCAEHPAWPALT